LPSSAPTEIHGRPELGRAPSGPGAAALTRRAGRRRDRPKTRDLPDTPISGGPNRTRCLYEEHTLIEAGQKIPALGIGARRSGRSDRPDLLRAAQIAALLACRLRRALRHHCFPMISEVGPV